MHQTIINNNNEKQIMTPAAIFFIMSVKKFLNILLYITIKI